VLELGCGAGANIPLFRTLGVNYFAIEGSPSIVKQLHVRFPDLTAQILVGDFTEGFPFPGCFDLIIDRASVTHNDSASIRQILDTALQKLVPGGMFIGSDWFSKSHSDFLNNGASVIDESTRAHYSSGQFAGVGKVHFSDEQHLRDLFSQFEIVFLEEKFARQYEPASQHQVASWNIVARKRA